MYKLIRNVLIVMIAISTLSCEKLFIDPDPSKSHTETFEYLWKQVDEQYSYFELKNINWDSVYHEYSLLVDDDMAQLDFFNLMFDMLETLEDGHVNLYSPFNVSRYPDLAVPDSNYDTRLVRANYLSDHYIQTGPFQHDFVHKYIDQNRNIKAIDTVHVNGNPNDVKGIAYVRYSSFSNIVTDYDIDFVTSQYGHTTIGMIIDVRSNGGGSPLNIFQMCERFLPADAGTTTLYYSRNKTGPGEDDFDDWMPANISPDGLYYPGKIVILTDKSCYSATSYFATAMKSVQKLRDVKIMGVPTGGGLGAPRGGQLPNGWYYRMSVTQTRSVDGDLDFELGVPPDIVVTQQPTDYQNNIDTILEAAVDEIKNGQW